MTAGSPTSAQAAEKAPKQDIDEVPAKIPRFGRRYVQLMLMSVGLGLAYSCRINLSMCIVAMTSKDSANGYQVFEWDQRERGLVLSSFFWGYVLMQVPGAALANRFGPHIVLLVGLCGCSVLSCAAPLGAMLGGWRLLCAMRMACGLCQGVIFPCSHYMLGRWVPPVERSRATAMVFSGPSIGTLTTLAGVGLLCSSALGWPSGFYVPGALGLLWCIAWWFVGANHPSECKSMSEVERRYIKDSLGDTSSNQKGLKVPWVAMLRAPCTWAIIVTHICCNFGHWLMLTQLPNYMKTMLDLDMANNGLMSSLPYLCLVFASILVGWLSQRLVESGRVSIVASRKIFNSIALYGMGGTLLVLSFLTTREVPKAGVIALLTLVVSLESSILAGFLVNHVDLTPNFGGAMLGVTNGLGNVMGIVAPILVSLLVSDAKDVSKEELAVGWSHVFLIGGCVYCLGNTVFLILGRADVQPWNSPKGMTKDDVKASKETVMTYL